MFASVIIAASDQLSAQSNDLDLGSFCPIVSEALAKHAAKAVLGEGTCQTAAKAAAAKADPVIDPEAEVALAGHKLSENVGHHRMPDALANVGRLLRRAFLRLVVAHG